MPILIKPSPQTPFTALALGELILKAGWPEEALAILTLSNADTAWLAEKEDRIKLVSFTGSAKVGWELKAHSGRKRVLLELGGNAALVIHGDYRDLDSAAERAAHAGFGLCRTILHQRAAGLCRQEHLSDLYLEVGGDCGQARLGRSRK